MKKYMLLLLVPFTCYADAMMRKVMQVPFKFVRAFSSQSLSDAQKILLEQKLQFWQQHKKNDEKKLEEIAMRFSRSNDSRNALGFKVLHELTANRIFEAEKQIFDIQMKLKKK